MQLNKLLSIILSLVLCISAFIFPFMKAANYSYAINDDVLWQPLNSQNELVDVFQSYCKSRDLTIEGSVADAVTTATTGTFNGLCNKLGIDVTALQADIKKSTDSMGNIQYLFDSNGITAYNRIFAQFLQDNELEVGSPADKSLYSGEYGTDSNGNGFLFYVIPRNPVNGRNYRPIVHGSTYIYNNQTMVDLAIHNNDRYQFNPFGSGSNNYLLVAKASNQWRLSNASGIYKFISGSNSNTAYAGNLGIAYSSGYTSDIRIGVYTSSDDYFYDLGSISIANQQNVNITIVSPTINNNTYEGDTIINNQGDVINNEGDTNIYNPYPDGGGTTTGPNNTGGGSGEDDTDITFPNFDFQLPEIDWSLGDLSDKFPFSIPFDLIAFFTVLNAAPEAPAIDAEIPLGDWYTWHFEADFSQFDNYAAIIRNVEFIAFCIGLIYLTIRLVKG